MEDEFAHRPFLFFCILLMPRQGDNALFFFPAIICFRLKAWNCMGKHKKACLCRQAKVRAWRCITVPGGRRVQFTPSGFETGFVWRRMKQGKIDKEPQRFFIVHFKNSVLIIFLNIAVLCTKIFRATKIFLTCLFAAEQNGSRTACSVWCVLPCRLCCRLSRGCFSGIYIDAELIRINIATNVVQHVRMS